MLSLTPTSAPTTVSRNSGIMLLMGVLATSCIIAANVGRSTTEQQATRPVTLARERVEIASVAPTLAEERVEIAPGVYMPLVNLGGGDHAEWFRLGGRGADTAYDYGDDNQNEVGRAVRSSTVPRSELFVTTKIPCCPAPDWCSKSGGWWEWPDVAGEDGHALGHGSARDVRKIAEHNFEKLGLDYVDLMILHFPCATPELSLQRYRVLEALHSEGKVRAIGVSNFDAQQLTALVSQAAVPPAVNQFGFGLGTPQTGWMADLADGRGDRTAAALARTQALNVTAMAYGPLGRTTGGRKESILLDPTVGEVATVHGVSSAQVALRWVVQKGVAVVTSGTNTAHYAEDVAVTRFALDGAEMAKLAKIV